MTDGRAQLRRGRIALDDDLKPVGHAPPLTGPDGLPGARASALRATARLRNHREARRLDGAFGTPRKAVRTIQAAQGQDRGRAPRLRWCAPHPVRPQPGPSAARLARRGRKGDVQHGGPSYGFQCPDPRSAAADR